MKHLFNMKVLGLTYEVHEDGGELRRLELYGESRYTEQQILLSEDVLKEKQREVLLHEIIHTATHDVLVQDLKLNEQQVSALSAALYQVLVDNASVREFLFADTPPSDSKGPPVV